MFFDLSWSHILLLLIVALVVVGPKDLPRLMRTAGQWVAKARAMADQFKKSFDEMARQSELEELRAELDSLRRDRPLADIDRTLRAPVLPPPNPAAVPADSPAVPPDPPAASAVPRGAPPGPRPVPPVPRAVSPVPEAADAEHPGPVADDAAAPEPHP